MSLINCKVEFTLFRWMKHCVSAGVDNDNANSNFIIFYNQRHKTVCSGCYFINKTQSKTINTS